ncbi:transcription factor bHLH47 isoform X2 [Vigna radiata var. radiata]|uniref:Transcription factor bHLH47 isoform X2 n=1 Tax=Vigna radiata var. radiata TaxID=3916 RepID=A0A1S3TPM7_VIGRR|nr:transcription factor bHLH47 isoform X2 [Vigna radiata var. radiata]
MMGSETSATVVEKLNNSQDLSRKRSCSNKQKQEKIPKRIRKAEREKEKREQLNELFLGLAHTLDLKEQNNGKASILRESIRLLKDLFSQIESLKKDSVSLLSETHYVTMEKNEMVEENCVLKSQIEKLAGEIEARVVQCGHNNLMNPFPEAEKITEFSGENLQLSSTEAAVQQGHAVLVVPVSTHHGPYNVIEQIPKPRSSITKPHPRYPTPMDSWPLQLLAEQPTSN